MFFSHYLETGHEILSDDFQIIQSTNASDLKTAESISIHSFKPSLNGMVLFVPLIIWNCFFCQIINLFVIYMFRHKFLLPVLCKPVISVQWI